MFEGHRYIDSDAHVLEPPDLWQRYLDPQFQHEMPISRAGYERDPFAYYNECFVHGVGMPSFLVGVAVPAPGLEEAYGEYQELGWSPEVYKRVLDKTGIDKMVLYPTVGLFATSVPSLTADTAAAYRRAYNRWLRDFCSEADDRVVGIASLDLRDPAEAAREAHRCVKEYGFRGVTVHPNPVTSHPLFHEFHDPLWQALCDLDVPIGFHSGAGTPLDVGFGHFPTWGPGRSVASFSFSYMLTCMAMIGGGVLERFPTLRLAFLEAGCGWLPYLLDRMQAGIQGSNRAESRFLPMEGLTMHPVDYFRRQCFVASDPDDPHLAYAISELGDECIVTATDFGHPEGRGYLEAIGETLAIPGIADESKAKIMWDNAARLYGIS